VSRNFPKESKSSVIDNEKTPIKIDKYNFIFLFGLLDNSNNFVNFDTDYFDIKVEINKIENNKSNVGDENFKDFNKIEKEELDLVKCNNISNVNYKNNDDKIFKDIDTYKINRYDEILSKINLNNYICLKNSIDIFGNPDDDNLNFLEIQVKPCFDFFGYLNEELKIDKSIILTKYKDVENFGKFDEINSSIFPTPAKSSFLKYSELLKAGNLTELFDSDLSNELNSRKMCPLKDLKNIKDIFDKNSKYSKNLELNKKGQFVFKYIKTNFDGRKWSDYAIYTMEEFKIRYEKHNCKEIDIHIKTTKYKTDNALILETYQDSYFLNIEKIEKNIYKSEDTNIILRINANKITDIVFRKYLKLQMLMAEIGGCIVFLFIFSLFLNYFNNNAKYYEKLIDELFDVDDVYKYSQMYNSTKKINIKRYRDSIMLRNTKDFENYRRCINKRADKKMKTNILNNFAVESSDNLYNVLFIIFY